MSFSKVRVISYELRVTFKMRVNLLFHEFWLEMRVMQDHLRVASYLWNLSNLLIIEFWYPMRVTSRSLANYVLPLKCNLRYHFRNASYIVLTFFGVAVEIFSSVFVMESLLLFFEQSKIFSKFLCNTNVKCLSILPYLA